MNRKSTDRKINQLLDNPLYDVRPDGTIWTLKSPGKGPVLQEWRRTGLTLKESRPTCKYWTIWYEFSQLRVARIIYRKYVGHLDPEMVIDHIDGDSMNDRPENLQQITNQQNALRGSMTKLTQVQVDEIRQRFADGESQASIAKDFRVTDRNISDIVRRITW